MNWEDILKAEAEAETKLNEAIKDAKWAYEQIENLMNYDTSSPENFFVNEQGQQEKIIQPNSYRGQRLKLQGVVNMLKEAHQTLLDVQTELRKPASGGNPDFDKTTPQQNLVDINTGQPIPFGKKQINVGGEWRDVE